jgi:hypothetical protein
MIARPHPSPHPRCREGIVDQVRTENTTVPPTGKERLTSRVPLQERLLRYKPAPWWSNRFPGPL